MDFGESSLFERIEIEIGAVEAHLEAVLGSEVAPVANAEAEQPLSGVLKALEALKGTSGDFSPLYLARGLKDKDAAAPRVMALALLHLASDQPAAPGRAGSCGELAAASPFIAAFEAEANRLRRLIMGGHAQVLERLAALGRQLPPTSGSPRNVNGGSAASMGIGGSNDNDGRDGIGSACAAARTGQATCERLRAAADEVAAALVGLDDCSRAALGVLARLASAYDDAVAMAHAAEAAAVAEAAPAATAGSVAHAALVGWPRREQPGRNGLQAIGERPVTAVCSHSAPGDRGKYMAGEFAASLDRGCAIHMQIHSCSCGVLALCTRRRLPAALCVGGLRLGGCGVAPGVSSRRIDACAFGTQCTAGVPPDVYHGALRHFLTGGGTTHEAALWALSVVHARIRHREAAAAALAAGEGVASRGDASGAPEWRAPDQVRTHAGSRTALLLMCTSGARGFMGVPPGTATLLQNQDSRRASLGRMRMRTLEQSAPLASSSRAPPPSTGCVLWTRCA